MEILVFALVAITSLYRREEKFVREPHTFQPLDIEALRHLYETQEKSSERPFDQPEPYVTAPVS